MKIILYLISWLMAFLGIAFNAIALITLACLGMVAAMAWAHYYRLQPSKQH